MADLQPSTSAPEHTIEWLEANATHHDFERDTPAEFAFYRRYQAPTGETYQRRLAGFAKVNPFSAPGSMPDDPVSGPVVIEIDGERSTVDVSTLERSIGQLDDANEFSCWVEHRLPGRDTPVKRSAHVTLKHFPGASGAAGSFT